MISTVFFLVIAVAFLGAVVLLLRSRKLREKYAALWIVVTAIVVVLALFPDLLKLLASTVGIAVPSNLLFALAILLLLGVALHLSLEVSRHDDETRTLSEEIAILRLQIHDVNLRIDPVSQRGTPTAPRTVDGSYSAASAAAVEPLREPQPQPVEQTDAS